MLRACGEFIEVTNGEELISFIILRFMPRFLEAFRTLFQQPARLGHSAHPLVLGALLYDSVIRNILIPVMPQRQGEIAGIPSTIGLSLIGDG